LLNRRFENACLDLDKDRQAFEVQSGTLAKIINDDGVSLVKFKLEVCAIVAPYIEAAALRHIAKATRVVFPSTKQQYPVVSMN
jgi:hypothetical protein